MVFTPSNQNKGEAKKIAEEIEPTNPTMISIPGGWFQMGISEQETLFLWEKEGWAEDWRQDGLFYAEQPQHRVMVEAFEIAKYPVTNLEYHRFIWESSHRVPKRWIGFRFPEGLELHPVVNISLQDAMAYCEWLKKKTGLAYRLPNEAEWEKAAKGPQPRIYPWGNTFDPWRCNTLESNKGGTTPIATYSPAGDSPYGVTDMGGNVWEWTSSLLLPYPFEFNPTIPPGKDREKIPNVVRGGAWYYSHKLARTTAREHAMQDYISPSLGFRLVRNVAQTVA